MTNELFAGYLTYTTSEELVAADPATAPGTISTAVGLSAASSPECSALVSGAVQSAAASISMVVGTHVLGC